MALLVAQVPGKGDASSLTDLELAVMFSPILILTEDTGHKWGKILPLKPEPVEIVGARSAQSLLFYTFNLGGKARDIDSFAGWNPQFQRPGVDFSANRFATLKSKFVYRGIPPGFDLREAQNFTVQPHFDFPGDGPGSWNAAYKRIGENFPNTAYVHIFKTAHESYTDSVTVLQYYYFYPYNHWWNRHEGDWPHVNVVIDRENLRVLGVEYLFHKAHLSYYEGVTLEREPHPGETITLEMPGLTSSFVFNPQANLRLSQGTHPVVYVAPKLMALIAVFGRNMLWLSCPSLIPTRRRQT